MNGTSQSADMPVLNGKRSDESIEPQINGHNDSKSNKARNRGNSVRSSSDGAVEAMEGSNEERRNSLYRTVSESDKQERARQNEIMMNNRSDDSDPETEGPDTPQECDGALTASNGATESDNLYNFESDDSPGILHQFENDKLSLITKPRTVSVAEVKEMAYAKLQEELQRAKEELKLKDEEVEKLSRIREEVSIELEDLTASLFQEAHNMVREANVKRAAAEKHLKEANLKIEVLQAEVQALKTLVITSTPSMPNPKLHPQIDAKSRNRFSPSNGRNGLSRHQKSPSNYELKFKQDSPPIQSPEEQKPVLYCSDPNPENEVDPIFHKAFISWKESCEFDKSCAFLDRIYREDISPCMNFPNNDLSGHVLESVENNDLIIEAVSGKNPFPKKCMLLDTPRLCKYKMKLGNSDKWYYISQLCRNRIAAVCELMCYLRYIKQGLVRSPINDVYWEIMRRRKEITFARLGLNSTT